jgi:membrane associated rhomboid family serine protease
MTRHETEPYSLLIEIARSPDVSTVNHALKLARIPFYSGLLAGAPPRVRFSVPAARLDEARMALARHVEHDLPTEPEPDELEPDVLEEIDFERDRRFPWVEVRTVAALVLAHLLQVLWVVGPWPPGRELLQLGGLLPGQTIAEPWRLVTSLFLHADPSHVLWNGLSMLVFAVPLLVRLGLPRTALIYLAAGTGGGVAAVAFANPGVVIIGSSGAVAGLFGAWIVLAGDRATLPALAAQPHDLGRPAGEREQSSRRAGHRDADRGVAVDSDGQEPGRRNGCCVASTGYCTDSGLRLGSPLKPLVTSTSLGRSTW